MKRMRQKKIQREKIEVKGGLWYTDQQVAAWRDIGRSTVWAHVKHGYLPAPHKIGPRTSRFSGTELLRHKKEVAA